MKRFVLPIGLFAVLLAFLGIGLQRNRANCHRP